MNKAKILKWDNLGQIEMKFVCKLIVPGVQSGKRSVAVKWRDSIEEEWKKEEGFDRVEELQLAEKIGLEPLFVHLYSFYLQGYFNTLRMEVYDKNVGVTMICPSLTYSNLFRNAYRENLEVCRWNFTVII